jgi:hypothetical protein
MFGGDQINYLNFYKCLIRTGVMSRRQAMSRIHQEAKKELSYANPALLGIIEGASEADLARSEIAKDKLHKCRKVTLAWITIRLNAAQRDELLLKLRKRRWFD